MSGRLSALRATLLLLTVFAAPLPAEATIAFVQNLGTGGTGGSIGASATVTTTGAVTAGNSIFVFVATNNGSDAITCSDPVNGTYTTDVNSGGLETAICSKHNALALPSGSLITVTVSPFPTNIRISTAEFAGLRTSSTPLDRTVVNNGIGTSMSATLGAATSQGPELLIGVFNANTLGAAVTFTEGTNGTANNCTDTGTPTYSTLQSAGGAGVANSVFPVYCIVNATGTYKANGSLGSSQAFTVALATYRMAEEATTTSISPSAPAVTYGTAQTFTATVIANSGPATGGTITFTDTTTATTLASGVAVNGSGQAATTVTLGAGPHTIQATYTPDIPHLGSSNTTSVTVNKASPTISTAASAGVAFGSSVSDTATIAGGATPTGTVTFKLYGPNDATCAGAAVFTDTKPVAGNGPYTSSTFTPAAAGAYRWIASYGGDANHNAVSGNCNDANESVTISKANQAITFPAIPAHVFGDPPFGVSATSSSLLTVTFSSTTPSVCTVAVATVTIIAAGTCTIAADQAGDANFNAAPQVPQSVGVTKSNQTITFGALANRNFGSAAFTVSATASSTLTVTFSSLTVSVCTVSGTTVTMVAVGTCTVAADQAGNVSYNAAPQVPQSFSVLAVVPAAPTIGGATAGNGSITVSFTAPAFTGGASITSYTATCGGASQVGASSPIIVSGLTNGTLYTCTVTATNSAGAGPASAPASATPSVNTFTGSTATGTGNATVTFTGGGAGCSFAPPGTGPGQSSFFIPLAGHPKSPPAGPGGGITFPQGLLDFVLVGCTPGSTVTFTVTYPGTLTTDAQYWKYGPTAAVPTPHWYILPATLTGNTAVFSITDGGLGDDDLLANGTVVDQGGPGGGGGGGAGGAAIPTLSEWAMILLGLLLVAVAWARVRPWDSAA